MHKLPARCAGEGREAGASAAPSTGCSTMETDLALHAAMLFCCRGRPTGLAIVEGCTSLPHGWWVSRAAGGVGACVLQAVADGAVW